MSTAATTTSNNVFSAPQTPQELTKEFLSQVLSEEYGGGNEEAVVVSSFKVREANAGVLSHVVMIDVEYNENNKSCTKSWPTKFVAKFLLSDFPQMVPMFKVESHFYQEFVSNNKDEKFAFDIPRPVYTSNSMIMVEYIDTTTTTSTDAADSSTKIKSSYTAVEGCPKELVIPVVRRLGKFHAKYLQQLSGTGDSAADDDDKLATICKDLASPAGVGSDLPGPAKEALFYAGNDLQEFLHNIPSELLLELEEKEETTTSAVLKDQIQSICQSQLHSRRLRDIHNTIHNHPIQTMIHGDFHVANMIFGPGRGEEQGEGEGGGGEKGTEKDDNNNNVWLLDWATCGKGFPLIDLAFFAIVSLTTQVRRQVEDDMLIAYHEALVGSSTTSKQQEDKQFISLKELKQLYKLCILNQFLILIGYDKLSRQILLKTPQIAKRPLELKHHFDIVNSRSCYAIIDHFGSGGGQGQQQNKPPPPPKQKDDNNDNNNDTTTDLMLLLPRHKTLVEKIMDYIFWVPLCRTILLLVGFQFWLVRRRYKDSNGKQKQQ